MSEWTLWVWFPDNSWCDTLFFMYKQCPSLWLEQLYLTLPWLTVDSNAKNKIKYIYKKNDCIHWWHSTSCCKSTSLIIQIMTLMCDRCINVDVWPLYQRWCACWEVKNRNFISRKQQQTERLRSFLILVQTGQQQGWTNQWVNADYKPNWQNIWLLRQPMPLLPLTEF